MKGKVRFGDIKAYVEKEGYALLSSEYPGYKIKMHLRCPQGHDCWISWDSFKNKGVRCKIESRKRQNDKTRKSLEDVKVFVEKEGYTLLSPEYSTAQEKLLLRCPLGHEYAVSWANFQQGQRCPIDNRERRNEQKKKEVQEFLEQEGYKLLSKRYVHSTAKLHTRCPNDHDYWVSWKAFRFNHQRCRCETNNMLVTIDRVRESMRTEGYTLLSQQYVQNTEHLRVRCPKGHIYNVSWDNWNQGHRCPKCPRRKSEAEREIVKLYKQLNLLQQTKSIITPLELDIYFPYHSLAIEYCGLYWHSTIHARITPSYHRHKLDLCTQQNIRLLTVFEDEWQQHKDICISRINNALGICSNKIYARKCKVKQISKTEAKHFLNRTHLQGYGGCRIAFGLFHSNTLVQVMTFSHPSRAHTAKGKRVLEMKRLASELDTLIVGGASRLLKQGIKYAKQHNYELVKSYCDLRWGTGNLYQQLRFQLTHETRYTLHYTDGTKRYRNQALATNKRKEKITEAEKAKKRRLYKIYDCGHQTWEYSL